MPRQGWRRLTCRSIASIRGREPSTFAFEGLGKLGSLGHFSAVAEILGIRISGMPAWLLWRCIYLAKMPGLSQKVRIGLDWLVALLFPPDPCQLKCCANRISSGSTSSPARSFNEGDFGDSVYPIEKGTCEVIREQEGEPQHVADLGGGDYFGEMAVLADVSRNATIRPTTSVDVLLIPKDASAT